MRPTPRGWKSAWVIADARNNRPIFSLQYANRGTNNHPEGSALACSAAVAGGLSTLLTHPNDGIAIQAAWQEVVVTIPEKEGDQAFRPDRENLNWFLGFLEGRARIEPPKWWARSLLDCHANRRGNVYFIARLHAGDDAGNRQPVFEHYDRLAICGPEVNAFAMVT